jgi:UPF0716 protein FxsA
MAWVFPLLFLAWPVVEIAVLIKIANWLGWPGAIAGIILSGLIGLALLRSQGLATARRVQTQMTSGEMPVAALFDAACLAVAGCLLMLPGFVTDLLALPLLLPPVRHLLRRLLAGRLVPRSDRDGRTSTTATMIEGEWTVVDEAEGESDPDRNNPPPPPKSLPRK